MAIPLLVSGIAFSAVMQRVEAQQSSQSGVHLRTARFWRGEGRTLLEGVFSLPVAQSVRTVDLIVRDSTGKVLHTETMTDSAHAQAAALAAMNAETTNMLELVVDPGRYDVTVRATQAGRSDSATASVTGFAGAPVISDVVVSARMRVLSANEEPSAVEMKRGRYAIERVSRVTVLPAEPRLWYYLELYRQGADSVAQLEFRVVPQGRDSALVRVNRTVAVGARGTVDAAALVVQGLPPGDYTLSVIAKSGDREERRESAFTMASFETAAPVAAATPGASQSEAALFDRYFAVSVRSDAEVNSIVEALTIGGPGELAPNEVMQYTADAKRRYLARYWSRIPDPNPATAAHEVVDEFTQRVAHVTKQYSEFRGRSGAKTDRGRIYLKYGPADASLSLEVSGSKKTAEIWKYTRRRAIKFVFLDETGFQNYNLIYTTDPQESTLADWQERVRDPDIIRQIITF